MTSWLHSVLNEPPCPTPGYQGLGGRQHVNLTLRGEVGAGGFYGAGKGSRSTRTDR